MDASLDRPLQRLFEEVFPEEVQRKKYGALSAYIEQDGSVFPLVEKGAKGLVRDFGLSPEDAHSYLRRANALATYVRRQFIEQALTGDETEVAKPLSGLLSMVAGPSFELLFRPSFDRLCPPDALESVASPVAYLIELLKWIEDRIEPNGDSQKMPLGTRRTDLQPLLIDFNAVHQSVSSVDIIIPVLETFIKAHSEGLDDLDEAMSQARYPNGLPYYRDWTTIDFVARQHDLSVGEVAWVVDLSSPYFLQPNGWSAEAERAMLQGSRLGPYQRELLTEDPNDSEDPDDVEAFYLRNFGAVGVAWQNINQVRFFCERTKLDATRIEALLSIRSFAPVRSANAPLKDGEPPLPSGAQSGSVYLNAGVSPSVGINFTLGAAGFLHRLTEDIHKLARYDRMNRKLRLDQWLGLPPEQVDALLMAAINAETRTQTPEHACWISPNTLRAIGLFQGLRERYGCTVEDFAVFIDQLSIFGRGETPSPFDRVFNPPSFSAEPLKLDGGDFPVFPAPGAEGVTVNQLCRGLGINLHTYRHLADAIALAQGKAQTLQRDVATLSSFYRLVKLPQLLGITPVEAIVLLMTLGGDSWLNVLAGVPPLKTHPPQDTTPDVLNVIHAMDACVRWCNEHALPMAWMLQVVAPIMVPSAASSDERQLFEQLRNLLTAALFSNAALLMAGVPPLGGGADWLDLLPALVDGDGLVLTQPEAIELDYLAYAREKLDLAVRAGIGEGDEASRAQIVEKMLDVLLLARAGQVSVVRECLAVYAGLRSELVVRVLTWAQGTVYQVLRQAFERKTEGDEVASYRWRAEDEEDRFLMLLADVRRRSAVVAKLDLGAELLDDYLAYGYRVWLERTNKYEFSLSTLYYLTVLTRAFALGSQPPMKLLDYLREVNALPDPLTGDALRLAQETAAIRLAIFFSWSIQEVRECAKRIDPDKQLIKNLVQLDLLMRVRVLADSSGMDAQTIFLMGTLPADIDRAAYSLAAEHALLSLSTPPVSFIPHDGEALEHTVKTTCVVDRTELVANKPNEQATYRVTVEDITGKGLSGVFVYWQTELGSINKSATNTSGVATAVFTPGKVMGTAAPRFWLDLHPKQQAPNVVIGADKTKLAFPSPLQSEVPDGITPFGQEVRLSAVMKDQYGNPGINRPVSWSADSTESGVPVEGVVRPSEALTNKDGVTQVYVSSPSGGTFEVSVKSTESGISALFEPITFAGSAKSR
ncbi:Tc toxin subunit A [Pseudomonas sp. 6D_7.1_Bac1]|uniref:Tc toxin subunit A n=1 Tax=Pseudomonas sp. 6D_7.1_Bac1 TaxID=2971615 RepID=UPI0021C6DDE7|nr:Tc toxin subunit A [Pseudomonas sp. 6D_7.1_Bac1]MCU1751292.1 Tc toxin subunit A [Pseudomonas sp. 6D_7.1_Bac1]